MAIVRAPEHIVHRAAQLDIVVGEFAELGIIQPQLFLVERSAQAEARNQVHHEEDDTGDDKRPREASNTVGKLVGQLNIVVVEPAAIDFRESVKMRDVITVMRD